MQSKAVFGLWEACRNHNLDFTDMEARWGGRDPHSIPKSGPGLPTPSSVAFSNKGKRLSFVIPKGSNK